MRVLKLLSLCVTLFSFSCQTQLSDEKTIGNMTTKELVQWYVYDTHVSASGPYNDPCMNYNLSLELNFKDAYEELFNRDDVSSEMMKEYKKLNPLAGDPKWTDEQKFEFGGYFTRIELYYLFYALPRKNFDNAELLNLKEAVISMYKKKKTLPEVFILEDDLTVPVGICIEIIGKLQPELLQLDLPPEYEADAEKYMETHPELWEDMRFYVGLFRYQLMVPNGKLTQFMDYIVELLENIEL